MNQLGVSNANLSEVLRGRDCPISTWGGLSVTQPDAVQLQNLMTRNCADTWPHGLRPEHKRLSPWEVVFSVDHVPTTICSNFMKKPILVQVDKDAVACRWGWSHETSVDGISGHFRVFVLKTNLSHFWGRCSFNQVFRRYNCCSGLFSSASAHEAHFPHGNRAVETCC